MLLDSLDKDEGRFATSGVKVLNKIFDLEVSVIGPGKIVGCVFDFIFNVDSMVFCALVNTTVGVSNGGKVTNLLSIELFFLIMLSLDFFSFINGRLS